MTERNVNAERTRFTAGGTSYLDVGQGDALVMIHGVGMNRAVWTPQIEAFASCCRVIAYDLLGHGDSSLPSADVQLAELTDQLIELLDDLGIERTHLVGHSMGALIALDLALRAPERVHGLVVLNGVYDRNAEQRAAVLKRAHQFALGTGKDTVDRTLERWFGACEQAVESDRLTTVRHWLETVDRCGYARVYACFAHADRELVGRLPKLVVPALFVTGEHDLNSTADMSRRMAAEAPYGRAHVVSGQRHMMAFAKPDSVNPLIADFLDCASTSGRSAVDCIERHQGDTQ